MAVLRLTLLLSLLATALPAAPAGPRSGRWAHETPRSLTPDPAVIWGRLDTGVRDALLPHAGGPGRVTMQWVVLAGSLDEAPQERGIAHYLEHLAFGGTANFPADRMVDLFQRLGVEYGSDVNAITTFDHTAYRLDFRENDAALLSEGLRLFRDFGDALAFDPVAIERERRVVLAELRNRDTLDGRRQQASLPVVFRGLRFGENHPGGKEDLIRGFTREQFIGFHRRNYRPDLTVLVVAGDFTAAALEAEVRSIFGTMAKPSAPPAPRDDGRLDARSERQQREFVMTVFARRLRRETAGAGASAGYEELLGHGVATAAIAVPAAAWSEGIRAVDGLVRLALERGLDPADLEEERSRELRMAVHAASQLPAADPAALGEELVAAITSHTVFAGPARSLAWRREWLERFTPADAQRVFRGLWPVDAMAFHLSGGIDLKLTPDAVLTEVRKARRAGVPQVMARTRRDTPFAVPRFTASTPVVERRELPGLGAVLARFGNEVRLNFVPSRGEAGLARAVVRVGTGLLELPGNKPALKEWGIGSLLASGGSYFRPERFSALVEERLLEFGLDVTDRDAFTFRGLMATGQLEVFLSLVADFLHAPVINSFAHQDQRMQAVLTRVAAGAGMGEGMRELTNHLFRGDARFTWGSPLDYMSLSVTDVRRWMEPSLARGSVEVTIVGDVTEPAAVDVVGRTLGALRPRSPRNATSAPPRPVALAAPAGSTRIEFVGEQNMGLVTGTWPVTGASSARDQAALGILAKVMELRVRTEVREKLGLAYAPSARFEPFDGFPDFALLQARIDCAPNDAGRVAPVIAAIGANLAARGVTNGEFIGARGILRGQLREAFRDNAFVAGLLMRAQERPEEAEEAVALHAGLVGQISLAEVNAWAARVLAAGQCRTAAVVPKAFVGIIEGSR
ncbi:MAG: M16 family metallopeptidase [Opitutaceae bacterium]